MQKMIKLLMSILLSWKDELHFNQFLFKMEFFCLLIYQGL